jgi:hypothetical protein
VLETDSYCLSGVCRRPRPSERGPTPNGAQTARMQSVIDNRAPPFSHDQNASRVGPAVRRSRIKCFQRTRVSFGLKRQHR